MDFNTPNLSPSLLRGQSEIQRLDNYRGLESKRKGEGTNSHEDLKEVGRQFDAIFARQMLRQMRKSVMKSTLFGDSSAQQMYQEMLDDQLAEAIGKAGGFGLGELVVKELESSGRRMTKEALQAYSREQEEPETFSLQSRSKSFDLSEAKEAYSLKTPETGRYFDLQPKEPRPMPLDQSAFKTLPGGDNIQRSQLKSAEDRTEN